MSYISGLSSLVKGERGQFFFNKDQFLFATSFATNPYFADELNWSKLALYYKDSTSGQRQIVILKDDHGRGWFCPSVFARTGAWAIDRIEVYDKQGDFFVVTRANMPSPATFDIAVQRIIAPSPSVATVPVNPELVVNGTFAGSVSGWTLLGGAQYDGANGGQAYQSAQSGINERGFLQIIPTIPGRTYQYSMQVVGGALDFLIGAGSHNTMASLGAGSYLVTRQNVPSSTITGQFVASSSSITVAVMSHLSTGIMAFDNVSIKEIPDSVEIAPGSFAGLEVGYKVKLWDDAAGSVLSADNYVITSIAPQETKDVITFDKQIVGPYAGKVLRLRFPSYSEVSGKQSTLFQYVGSGY